MQAKKERYKERNKETTQNKTETILNVCVASIHQGTVCTPDCGRLFQQPGEGLDTFVAFAVSRVARVAVGTAVHVVITAHSLHTNTANTDPATLF